MIATFDQAGIRFHYPENWHVTDAAVQDWPRTVSVQSPASGFWTLVAYDRTADPAELLDETLQQFRSEYPDVESSSIDDQFESAQATGYEMYFYCFDFLVCARALAVRQDDGQVMLFLWQAEDRDFAAAEPVFRAITTSLLREQARR
jgi:hypothetical protein